jgi:hypothetical protein
VTRKSKGLGVHAVAEKVHFGGESVRHTLMEELNMKKVCAKLVPKMMSDE